MKLLSRLVAFALPLAFTLLTTNAHAEEIVNTPDESMSEDSSSERIVVTANRYPTSIEEVGSSISVIDEEEIEKKKQPTVLELLRTLPGLEVSETGGPGRTVSVFIRGAESDHTLVLIDGVRANDNTTGQFDFANLKAENIERIEVLRGAQSVLYGSDAIGGVINIITKTAEEGTHGSVSVEAGSKGTQQYKAAGSFGSELFHTSTTVSYFDTDGISAAASNRGNPEGDSHDNFSISNRSGFRFLEDGSADLTVRYSTAEAELDGFDFAVGAVDDLNYLQENDDLFASFVITKSLTETIIPSIELGFADRDTTGIDPDTSFNNFTIDNQTQSVTTKVDFLMPWEGVVSVGHTYKKDIGENLGLFDEEREVNSFFTQKQFSYNDALFLTGGVRYDDDSEFGDAVTFRTTAAYRLKETGSRFHASYGTGFKTPSFNELFFPEFGNQDLEEETSWGYDVGVEQIFLDGRAVADVTFFQNEIDNLITFDRTTFLAANIEESSVIGVESAVSLELAPGFDTSLAYTYTDSENETTGGVLPRRPRHRAAFQVFAEPIEGLSATASLILVNSRRDSDRSKMDNYEVVNMALSYFVCDLFEPFIRIDNLFDEDYEEVNGFGTRGFSAYAGVKASL